MKLVQLDDLRKILDDRDEKNIVFTNGCFDILHVGHIRFLTQCKKEGDILIVGVNSDNSVSKIKGICRPIITFDNRVEVLSAIEVVDYIIGFDDETPYGLIRYIKPDVLVKGADWEESRIAGADVVKEYGGRIVRVPFSIGTSSSQIIYSILRKFGKEGTCLLHGNNSQQFEESRPD